MISHFEGNLYMCTLKDDDGPTNYYKKSFNLIGIS